MVKKLQRWGIGLVILLFCLGWIPPQSLQNHKSEAIALLRQHHQSPGVLRYHSQSQVYDDTGHVWQVILFKQPSVAANQNIHLRLVGFPGVVEFLHPRSLEINTYQRKLLSAVDVYNPETAPAPNVGEYLFNEVLSNLATTDALKLRLPLKSNQNFTLNIPENIISEWQLLVTEFE